MTRRAALVAVLLSTLGLTVLAASPSSADPATTVAYPRGAAATRYTGYAFDTCTAPAASTIRAWRASPYRALGIYIGGVTRSCAQPELTPAWVRDVSAQGWRLVPIYKGLQPWCGGRPTDAKITPGGATSEGTAAADDAVASARALGILPGSGIYLDIENYVATDTACRTGVLQFTSAYTRELHRRGYLSGVYGNLSSGAKHLAQAYTSPSYARPDALWIARWDRVTALTGWAGIPDSRWAVHQRAKQYRGGHDETYGGVTLNIDNDRFDAPVATVAHGYKVASASALNGRSAPSTTSSVVRTYPVGATVPVVCQTAGSGRGHHPRVGQARRRELRHRLLRQHSVERHLQRTSAALHLPVPGDHPDHPQQAHRARYRLSHRGGRADRWSRLDRLPGARLEGRHHLGVGPAG